MQQQQQHPVVCVMIVITSYIRPVYFCLSMGCFVYPRSYFLLFILEKVGISIHMQRLLRTVVMMMMAVVVIAARI